MLAAILARPLFSPSRRPAATLTASAAPPAVLPRLAGTIVHGVDRSVIFTLASGGKPVVAHEGSVVGGYTVRAIQAGRVTLAGSGRGACAAARIRPANWRRRPFGAAAGRHARAAARRHRPGVAEPAGAARLCRPARAAVRFRAVGSALEDDLCTERPVSVRVRVPKRLGDAPRIERCSRPVTA